MQRRGLKGEDTESDLTSLLEIASGQAVQDTDLGVFSDLSVGSVTFLFFEVAL